MIAWEKATREDHDLAKKIVDRAAEILEGHIDKNTASMDIIACHVSGCPLKLKELFEADDFNLLHDIRGIQAHIDRNTGKLQRFFSPRYSA